MFRTRPAWLVPLLLLMACEDRVGQCNELIGRLNPHTEAMIEGVEGLTRIETEPQRIDALLTVIETADQDLARIQLEDQRLAGFVLRYRRQLEDARAAAEALRTAAEAEDAKGLNSAAKQADAFLDAQAATVEQLNTYCSGGGG